MAWVGDEDALTAAVRDLVLEPRLEYTEAAAGGPEDTRGSLARSRLQQLLAVQAFDDRWSRGSVSSAHTRHSWDGQSDDVCPCAADVCPCAADVPWLANIATALRMQAGSLKSRRLQLLAEALQQHAQGLQQPQEQPGGAEAAAREAALALDASAALLYGARPIAFPSMLSPAPAAPGAAAAASGSDVVSAVVQEVCRTLMLATALQQQQDLHGARSWQPLGASARGAAGFHLGSALQAVAAAHLQSLREHEGILLLLRHANAGAGAGSGAGPGTLPDAICAAALGRLPGTLGLLYTALLPELAALTWRVLASTDTGRLGDGLGAAVLSEPLHLLCQQVAAQLPVSPCGFPDEASLACALQLAAIRCAGDPSSPTEGSATYNRTSAGGSGGGSFFSGLSISQLCPLFGLHPWSTCPATGLLLPLAIAAGDARQAARDSTDAGGFGVDDSQPPSFGRLAGLHQGAGLLLPPTPAPVCGDHGTGTLPPAAAPFPPGARCVALEVRLPHHTVALPRAIAAHHGGLAGMPGLAPMWRGALLQQEGWRVGHAPASAFAFQRERASPASGMGGAVGALPLHLQPSVARTSRILAACLPPLA
jgi:hypothetical protein